MLARTHNVLGILFKIYGNVFRSLSRYDFFGFISKLMCTYMYALLFHCPNYLQKKEFCFSLRRLRFRYYYYYCRLNHYC